MMKKQIYIWLILILMAFISTVPASADNSVTDRDSISESTCGELNYTIIDGEAVITGVVDRAAYKKFEIPEQIDGFKVTRIGKDAFRWCKKLQSVEIPENITAIEDGAFWDCAHLSNIRLPDGITYLGRDIIEATNYANHLNWDDGLMYLGDRLVMARDRENNTNGHGMSDDVIIRDGTTLIADGVFDTGFSYLKSITVPASVTTICGTALVTENKDVVMKGYEGTAAQSYAAEHGLKFESLGTASGQTTSYWSDDAPSKSNQLYYFSYLVSSLDLIGIVFFILLIAVTIYGMLVGPTKKTTVKTYYGGKLVNTQSYSETAAERMFGSMGSALANPAPDVLQGMCGFLFAINAICAVLVLITMIRNWSDIFMYNTGSTALLIISIACILLTLMISFLLILLAKKSLILTVISILIRAYIMIVNLFEYKKAEFALFSIGDQKGYIRFTLVADMLSSKQDVYKILSITTVIAWFALIIVVLCGNFVFRNKKE